MLEYSVTMYGNNGAESAPFTWEDAAKNFGEHNIVHAQHLLNETPDPARPSELSIALAVRLHEGTKAAREASTSGQEMAVKTNQFYEQIEKDVFSGRWVNDLLLVLKVIETGQTDSVAAAELGKVALEQAASSPKQSVFRKKSARTVQNLQPIPVNERLAV